MESKVDSIEQNGVEIMSYLTQVQATELDELLTGPLGFTVYQLMVSVFIIIFFPLLISLKYVWYMLNCFLGFLLKELAALSVATAIAEVVVFTQSCLICWSNYYLWVNYRLIFITGALAELY